MHVSSRDSSSKKTGSGADLLGTRSGAYRTSPVAVMQVEVGEQPLRTRRIRLMLAYWIQGDQHTSTLPAKAIFENCRGHHKTILFSFGWFGNVKVESL